MKTTTFIFSCILTHVSLAWAQSPAPAADLTLQTAFVEAYQKNPDLEAARANLRSIDENYAQAVAGFKPTVGGVADYTSNHASFDTGTTHSDAKTLSLQVTQSLYQGGSTVARVSQSDNEIKAGRARLKMVEQQVLLSVVSAYMNYIRDQEVVELNQNNEKVLSARLDSSNERFKIGDVTKTDVSQAESRLAQATARRISAEGEFRKSRAVFERVVGLPPEHLQKPSVKPQLPATEDEALAIAMKANPSLFLAQYTEAAAKDLTRSVKGEALPKVDLSGSMNKIYDPANFASDDEDARTIGIRASLPLYTGGATLSRIRQAQQVENQRRLETYSAERAVRQAVVEAWEELAASEAESKALQAQIEASGLAREGVKVEQEYGSRTILDLLDAEQEYLDAQVGYVIAETNRTIASYALLSAVGGLTAEGLKLNVPVYDPAVNFQNLKAGAPRFLFHKTD